MEGALCPSEKLSYYRLKHQLDSISGLLQSSLGWEIIQEYQTRSQITQRLEYRISEQLSEISVRQPKCLIIFRRLANLAAGNDNVEIVENENTEMFYVKIKPQLVNDPVQGFGDRAVLGLFQMQ